MLSRFFIDRPVFASVLSILIALCGLASLWLLPIEQSPEITPPTVSVSAFYPGANAETVAESLATPIEQELSGIENLLYYQSQSSNDGGLGITLTFDIGTDIDIATVEVQNRVKRAEPRLPEEVIRQGVAVRKMSTNILSFIALNSTNPQHDAQFLSNYATIHMVDALRRVPGIGDAYNFGGNEYSMRIWLNPDRLAGKGLTVLDVANAVREQNGLYAGGRIGAEPTAEEVALTFPVITRGRLDNPEEFENIILRAEPDGSVLKVKDVGRVELGAQSYDTFGRVGGKPTAFLLTFLQPGANALSTMIALRDTLEELSKGFPEGVQYDIPFDTTRFIEISIHEVAMTFFEAALLVILVVFIFLGSWRATVIPLVAVPVAIVGTFTGMLAAGFSINSLTLFGLVLAIGIVVDDAIVVVENVERIMHEEHLPVREATIKAMEQVTGPVIAIVLVLSAVYLPVAFLGGVAGVMYRQFGVTIAISVAISGLVALTLSPALCRLLLRPTHKKLGVFRAFDRAFGGLTRVYTGAVRIAIKVGVVSVLVFGVLLWATYDLFQRVPSGFIPQEDQGYFMVAALLPQGASLQRTEKVVEEIEAFLVQQPEIDKVTVLGGQDFLAGRSNSPSAGMIFVKLADWEERKTPDKHVDALVGRVFQKFGNYRDARILAINPPAIRGLGLRAGFELQLESRGESDVRKLGQVANDFLGKLRSDPAFSQVIGSMDVTQPQLHVDLDRVRAKAMGLSIADVYNSLQAYLGSLYVNDFAKFGRIYRVQLQAESEFRSKPEDIQKIYVRNNVGEMVELSSVLDLRFQSGPNVVGRFNSFPAVTLTGAPGPGFSTGEAMDRLTRLAGETLPEGYEIEWSGGSFQEAKAGGQAMFIILFGLVVVYLVLAAQYEKWSMPLAVMLAVPFGAFGAVLAVYLRDMSRDIYFQIGLLTLIGLAAKNAILIVEFASSLHEQGRGLIESAVEAARLRLRPIIMTSLAFILGVLPLAISGGAGAAGRQSIGTGVMGGMLAATFLAILFVPLFFVIVQKVSEFRPWRRRKPPAAQPPTAETT